ncbi:MAG: hypothetical protein FVQ83_03490 [Chloroflexi bacterium]|nr:hypothetical protein [Chloroflexota bacterium]
MTENDGKVFISYRRKVSVWQAWVIFLLLREIHNEEVWFDLVTQFSFGKIFAEQPPLNGENGLVLSSVELPYSSSVFFFGLLVAIPGMALWCLD